MKCNLLDHKNRDLFLLNFCPQLLCGILVTMKRKEGEIHKKGEIYRPQITIYDDFTLSPKEKEVYHAILKETILKNRRCVKLSYRELEKITGIDHNTINFWIPKLEKRRLIEVDRTNKTHIHCITTLYKERWRI